MLEPVTTLDYPTVKISFVAPYNNGRDITAYQVQIYSYVDNDFIENTAICDGSSATFQSTLECDVSMMTFISTFGYQRS